MTKTLSRALPAVVALVLSSPAMASNLQYGPLQLSGFLKEEFSMCDNCAREFVNPSPYDPRGVLIPVSPTPPLNQGGRSRYTSSNLGLAMLTAKLSHQFDNAIGIEAVATGRERNNGPDIPGLYLINEYLGISYPRYGSLHVGVMTSRAWTRADSFAYRLGLSDPWADSGAGYGVFKEAIRYTAPVIYFPTGKLTLELTYATAGRQYPLNYKSLLKTVTPANYQYFYLPPKPQLIEFFAQYSTRRNLIELTYQQSEGGLQSSFPKGAFVGSIGSPNTTATAAPGYRAPTETLVMIEGNFWPVPQWRITYGLKRNEWSGQQQQCDYGTATTPSGSLFTGCFWDQAGFNYASDGLRHHAIEYDALAGVAYTRGLWTFTFGGVYMAKSATHSPTEWGQSNSATFLNLGVYHKFNGAFRHFEVYAGLERIIFSRQGPAPLSMPSNIADGGVDPRTSQSGDTLTIGANLTF